MLILLQFELPYSTFLSLNYKINAEKMEHDGLFPVYPNNLVPKNQTRVKCYLIELNPIHFLYSTKSKTHDIYKALLITQSYPKSSKCLERRPT